MKVKAIEKGYYNNKRMVKGTVFHIKDKKAFSKVWMVEVKKGNGPKSNGPKIDEPEVVVEGQEQDVI